MKKSFYFAALAMIALSSCSSDEAVEDVQEATQSSELVPVDLSIGKAVIGVSTRGTGTVGSVATDEQIDNNWNNEKIRVLMTDDQAADQPVVFTSVLGLLPIKDGATAASDFYGQFDNYFYCLPVVGTSSVALDPQPKDGMQRYYHVNKKSRFFAYYVDDAEPTGGWNYALPAGADPTKSPKRDDDNLVPELKDDATSHSKYVEFKIDGSQDIMAGVAFDGGNKTGAYTFSAAGARKSTPQKPVVCMDHLLTRLNFTYTAGNGDGIEGVVIKKVEVASATEGKLTVAYNSEPKTANELITWTNETTESYLALKDPAAATTSGVKPDLVPFAAKIIAKTDVKKDMGDALFLHPGQHAYQARVTLLFPINTNPAPYNAAGPNPDYNEEVLEVVIPAGTDANAKFERGKSYQINFTFYGYQNANVDVQLTGWISGGSIEPEFNGDFDQ